MATSSDCSICCDGFKKTNQRVLCPNANCESNTSPEAGVCNKCVRRYLVETVEQGDAHCAVCKRGYSHVELLKIFPTTWVRGEYADKRRTILLERQKAMLPESQVEVNRRVIARAAGKVRRERAEQTRVLKMQIGPLMKTRHGTTWLRDKVSRANDIVKILSGKELVGRDGIWYTGIANEAIRINGTTVEKAKEDLATAKKNLKVALDFNVPITAEIRRIEAEIRLLNPPHWRWMGGELVDADIADAEAVAGGAAAAGTDDKVRRSHTFPCPGERCNAFIIGRWNCGVCGVKVCRTCREILPAGVIEEGDAGGAADNVHVCKPEVVETVKAIAKDTKNCPGCAVPISFVSGCSQMHCTNCHKTFDWKTLKIQIGGVIHNPHYFEYKHRMAAERRAGAHVATDPDQCEDPDVMETMLRNIAFNNPQIRITVHSLSHIDVVERARIAGEDREGKRSEMRIKFLEGDYTEVVWRKQLLIIERDDEWKRANLMLLDTLVRSTKDILRSNFIYGERASEETVQDVTTQIVELTTYLNSEAQALALSYGKKSDSGLVFRTMTEVGGCGLRVFSVDSYGNGKRLEQQAR